MTAERAVHNKIYNNMLEKKQTFVLRYLSSKRDCNSYAMNMDTSILVWLITRY